MLGKPDPAESCIVSQFWVDWSENNDRRFRFRVQVNLPDRKEKLQSEGTEDPW